MLVAIDGPAGSGKSTVARAVAERLGFTYLDTGAMYRCVALASERVGIEPTMAAATARIELGERVMLEGEDVTVLIRSSEISSLTSQIASEPAVREEMVTRQRELLAHGNWVAEGRDIGTVVAPNAELKVFLTASDEERARRRASELGADAGQVLAEQAERDLRDSTRDISPLRPADDAIELDTTGLEIAEVTDRIVELAGKAGAEIAS